MCRNHSHIEEASLLAITETEEEYLVTLVLRQPLTATLLTGGTFRLRPSEIVSLHFPKEVTHSYLDVRTMEEPLTSSGAMAVSETLGVAIALKRSSTS